MVKQTGIYFMYIMKYYLAKKGEWAIDTSNNLDEYWKLMLSQKSQSQNVAYCLILSWNDNIIEIENRLVCLPEVWDQGGGPQEVDVALKGQQGSLI